MSESLLESKLLENYLNTTCARENEVQKNLRLETEKLPQAGMRTTADQAAFLATMIKVTGAKRVIEIGTFTGYSALAMAQALPDDGVLFALDSSEQWTSVGKKFWQQAGVDKKINLILQPALKTLPQLIEKEGAGSFDFIFIDADKKNYIHYYPLCLKLLKPGGVVLFENMLWSGKVADPAEQDDFTVALRDCNTHILSDHSVDSCMISIGDGILLARKK